MEKTKAMLNNCCRYNGAPEKFNAVIKLANAFILCFLRAQTELLLFCACFIIIVSDFPIHCALPAFSICFHQLCE